MFLSHNDTESKVVDKSAITGDEQQTAVDQLVSHEIYLQFPSMGHQTLFQTFVCCIFNLIIHWNLKWTKNSIMVWNIYNSRPQFEKLLSLSESAIFGFMWIKSSSTPYQNAIIWVFILFQAFEFVRYQLYLIYLVEPTIKVRPSLISFFWIGYLIYFT